MEKRMLVFEQQLIF